MIPHVITDTERNKISIIGLYPLSYPSRKNKIKRTFENFSLSNNKPIIVNHITEPTLFLDIERQINVFEFLHQLINHSNSNNEVIFNSANIYASDCYDKWCKVNNVKKKLTVNSVNTSHYISRIISHGYNLKDTEMDKTVSLLIGSMRLHKQYVTKWYLENIFETEHDHNFISSFVTNLFSQSDLWSNDSSKKFLKLPGSFNDNKKIRPQSLTWSKEPKEKFNKQFSRCLFNFCVDYVEFEDFNNLTEYESFKQNNSWWHENFISEKTFKCILFKKPFIRLGMPHSLKVLHSWGFKTFDGILFNEEYDNIEDFSDRFNHIISQVEAYATMSLENAKKAILFDKVQEVVEHNYKLALDIVQSDKYI